ncbi:uncharacterized protein TRIREDRAFT_109435 [Trichoderma reesei QM6a]|uniref:Predicted protein n=1 Tax=Hypocrea jecorina (strain QM6a) TaxID=431241 RepID=G0RPW1_HYPJQ|nr:uncharacterized protein TRIREDRAFT_109435 [Trichoderma reesei QM6a]EGR46708.1 predicted protein [Trichoderma reesei QM6a]
MAIAPITGMLRRQLILDLGVGLGKYRTSLQLPAKFWRCFDTGNHHLCLFPLAYIANTGAGFVMANWYWYGYHMPRTNSRDAYYAKKEAERAAAQSQAQ